jgi:hypothetical protein
VTSKRSIPELSIDTQTIERLLITSAIGEVISYDAMTSAIGRDVRDARHLIASACRRLLREQHMVFAAVVNVGLKRLDDAGKIGAGQWHLQRVRRQAKFAVDKTTAVEDFDALPNALKVEHNVVLAQAGVLKHFTSRKTAKRIGEGVNAPTKRLSLQDSLAAMKPVI